TIAEHPAAAFLVFFYVTGWIFFLPALLGTSGFGLLAYDLPPQPSILLLTLVGLAGGAFLVTRIAHGKEGVRELRSRYFTWRTGPQWYLLALFGAPLLLLFLAGGLTDSGRLTASEVPEYVFYLLVLFAVPVRLILTWVFNSTGGSLPLVALLHASFDVTASAAILTGFYPGVDGRLMYFG